MSSNLPPKPLDQYPLADMSAVPVPPIGAPNEPQTAALTQSKPVIAQLNFLSSNPQTRTTVTLTYPFEFEGAEIKTITVRRLSIGEVGHIAAQQGAGTCDLFDFYAAMAGLPAPVLRALMDVDGEAVLEAALPFLPRVIMAALSMVNQPSGDAIPLS